MSYVVIKCGGSVMDVIHPTFYENIVTMMKEYRVRPIIVHGGGPTISSMLNKLAIETTFIDGMRVTDDRVLDVVEMVLSGTANKYIVRQLLQNGGNAIGISGVDGMLLQAEPLPSSKNLGYVGKVTTVKQEVLTTLFEKNYIPVISPVAIDQFGKRWNINADLAAAAIAKEFHAPLCFVTNVPGITKNGLVYPQLSEEEVEHLIKEETITGGMIPKVKAVLDCLREGIKEVVILNGMEEDALKQFVMGKPIGTVIHLASYSSNL